MKKTIKRNELFLVELKSYLNSGVGVIDLFSDEDLNTYTTEISKERFMQLKGHYIGEYADAVYFDETINLKKFLAVRDSKNKIIGVRHLVDIHHKGSLMELYYDEYAVC